MKFAVVGTGLIGLAVARMLQKTYPGSELTLIDEDPLKGGASHIAAGMVHTLVGHEGKRHPEGQEAFMQARALIREVEDFKKERLFFQGLLRAPRDSRFIESLKASDPSAWLSKKQVYIRSKGCVNTEGLWIENGGQLFVEKYLKGMLDLLLSNGAIIKQKKIEDLSQLSEYDFSTLALGFGFKSCRILGLPELSFKLGQLAVLKHRPPCFPVIGRAYIAQSPTENHTIVGGTYENLETGPTIDAVEKLLSYASLVCPSVEEGTLIARLSAIRAYGPNKKPFCTQLSNGVWAVGGVGSKGILLHAHLARALVGQIKKQVN